MAEIQSLIYKSECVLSRIRTLLYTKFTEENQMEMDNEVTACLEEYCDHLIQVRNGESTIPENDVIFLDEIFNDIFTACRELLHIYERQKVIEQFQLLKQKFFQVSTMDTCKNYVKNLQNEVKEFNENLEANPYLKNCCLDLLEELEVVIKRIENAIKNVNLQVGVEAATGVLTLGSAAASGAAAVVSAVARTGSAVAGGTTAARGAAAAAIAARATNVPAAMAISAQSAVQQILLLSRSQPEMEIKFKKCKFKKRSENFSFDVSDKVLNLPVSFLDDPDFCSTILAITIFERVMTI